MPRFNAYGFGPIKIGMSGIKNGGDEQSHPSNSFNGISASAGSTSDPGDTKMEEMEKKHREAKQAWRHFADNLGKDEVKKFLGVRYRITSDVHAQYSAFNKAYKRPIRGTTKPQITDLEDM